MFASLLVLIFVRPFIASPVYPWLNTAYFSALLLYLLSWFILNKTSLKAIDKLKPAVLLSGALLLVSFFCNLGKTESLGELSGLFAGICLFIVAASADGQKRDKLIRVIVFTGFIVSLLAFYQYFFGFRHTEEFIRQNGLSLPFARDYLRNRRVFFPFITPNTLAGYLAMLIPLALIDNKRSWLAIPLSLALLLTRSLGGLLSVFSGATLLFVITGKLNKRNAAWLAAMFLAIGIVLISRIFSSSSQFRPEFSSSMRQVYWAETLKIIRAHPLAGVGVGNFNLTVSRYAHNSYLQIWAETGIIGLACFLWLAGAVFLSAVKRMKEKRMARTGQLLFVSAAAFLAHNFVDFTFFLPEISLIWWAILGMLYSCRAPAADKPA